MASKRKDFISIYEEYKTYAEKRHKKQGFNTHIRNFDNHILPYFKAVKDIVKIEKKDIINWQNEILDKNFSNKFNDNLYYTFSSFMNFCVDYDYLEENLVLKVEKFKHKIERKEKKVYNLSQFRHFRHYLDSYILKQFFNFMFFYGTRPSEAMALRFCDIDKNLVSINHSIHRRGKRELDTPKNQSSLRQFYISSLMLHRFKKLKRVYIKKYGCFKSDYFVFSGTKPLSSSTIDRHKKKACKKANIYEITQHEFRHSYATRLIHKKVPIDYVSRSMGHSRVSMTLDTYLHKEKRTRFRIPFTNKFI